MDAPIFPRSEETENHICVAQAFVACIQGRRESSEWQDKWQHAVKELADVKERAWTLLEEKDVQLQALKVTHPACVTKHICHSSGCIWSQGLPSQCEAPVATPKKKKKKNFTRFDQSTRLITCCKA